MSSRMVWRAALVTLVASGSARLESGRAGVLRSEPGPVQGFQLAGDRDRALPHSLLSGRARRGDAGAARMAERAYARLSRILGHQFREKKPIMLLRVARRLRPEQRHRRSRRGHRRRDGGAAPPHAAAVHRRLPQLRARAHARDGARVPVRHLRARQGGRRHRSRSRRSIRRSGSWKAWPSICRSVRTTRARPRVDARRRAQRQSADDRADDRAAGPLLPVSLRPVALGVRRPDVGRRDHRRDHDRRAARSASSARSSARPASRSRISATSGRKRCRSSICRRSRSSIVRDTSRSRCSRRSARGGQIFLAPSLSPDGKYIAFLSNGSFLSGQVFIDLWLGDAEDGQAHHAAGEEHLRSELRGAPTAVFAERVLARRQAARVHRAGGGQEVLYLLDVKSRKRIAQVRSAARRHRGSELVAGRQAPRVPRQQRRHHGSLHRRRGRQESHAAHERPVRRPAAAVVARRQDDRVRHGSGAGRGPHEPALPAVADRALSRGWRATSSSFPDRRGSTSIRSGRRTRSRSRTSPIARAGRTSSCTISRRSSTISSRTSSAA